jgi:hypothetical protein
MTSFWYVLGTYLYVLVCTIIHFLFQYIQVRTKNPVPVQWFTIPDVGFNLIRTAKAGSTDFFASRAKVQSL